MSRYFLALLVLAPVWAAEHSVDPTFLRRSLSEVAEKDHYKPLFGEGDSIIRSVARFGQMTVDPGGSSKPVSYPLEEQVYFISEGAGELLYGDQRVPVHSNDFMYLPAGISHALANTGAAPLRAIVMGFKLRAGAPADAPQKPMVA